MGLTSDGSSEFCNAYFPEREYAITLYKQDRIMVVYSYPINGGIKKNYNCYPKNLDLTDRSAVLKLLDTLLVLK